MIFDQAAALAAHCRLRTSLPVVVVRDPDTDTSSEGRLLVGRWPKLGRPDWLPAIGTRCVIIGGHYAGLHGVVGRIEGSRKAPAVRVYADDGRMRYIRPYWVAPEGTPVPAVPMRRDAARPTGEAPYLPGDKLRVIGGPREGRTVIYLRRAGQSRPGIPNLRIRFSDGSVGTVLARLVERA